MLRPRCCSWRALGCSKRWLEQPPTMTLPETEVEHRPKEDHFPLQGGSAACFHDCLRKGTLSSHRGLDSPISSDHTHRQSLLRLGVILSEST